jgi:hypothetical protein
MTITDTVERLAVIDLRDPKPVTPVRIQTTDWAALIDRHQRAATAASVDRSHRAALWAIAYFNVGDVVLTKLALDRGASEGNPISAFLLDHSLLWPSKALLMMVFGSLAFSPRTRLATETETRRSWFVAGLYSCVVLVNTLTLWRYW